MGFNVVDREYKADKKIELTTQGIFLRLDVMPWKYDQSYPGRDKPDERLPLRQNSFA